MKNYSKYIFAALCVATISTSAVSAQNIALSTGYFNDGYVSKHFQNPAFTPDRGYFSFPILGNEVISVTSSLKAQNLFFPTDGGLATFLSPKVSVETAMAGIAKANPLNLSLNQNILSFGFFNKKGTIFTSIDLGARVNANVMLPYDLFAIAKGGDAFGGGKDYSLTGMDVSAAAHAELSLGQSYAIGKKVHFGYRAKFLVGLADVSAHFDKFDATLNSSLWNIDAKASLKYNGIAFGTTDEGYIDFTQFAISPDFFPDLKRNLGFAFDLGLSYDIFSWLQLSVSAQDLGMIFYHNYCTANSEATMSLGTEEGSETINEFLDEFTKLTQFKPGATQDVSKIMLPSTVRAGLQIRIPTYEKVSFGALYTHKIQNIYSGWEIRASFNYDICRALSFSASYAYTTPIVNAGFHEHQLGALLNLHAPGFNFFIGADNIPISYSVQGIPLSTASTTVNFGINFMVGKYHGRYPKAKTKN